MLEAYESVGGVRRALANEAEKVRSRLSADDQARLESIFVRLVRLGDTGGGATRRTATLEELDEKRRDLVQRLGQDEYGRLVAVGEMSAEIAHEALITQWPWLAARLNANASDVRRLDRLTMRSQDWAAAPADRRAGYLTTGAERELFGELAQQRPDWLSAKEKDFVAASTKAYRDDLANARKTARRTLIVAVAALAFALAAGAFGWYAQAERRMADEKSAETNARTADAINAKREADKAAQMAEEQKALANQKANEAIKERREAIRNQSVALTALGDVEAQQHPINAAKLALAAWPRDANDPAPKLDATLDLLGQVVPRLRERVRIPSDGTIAAFSPDGTRIVTAPSDGTAQIWDVADGRLIQTLKAPEESGVVFAAFRPDGNSVVTASKDGAVRIWDLRSATQIGPTLTDGAEITSADVSRDGTLIVAGYVYGPATIWNAATGAEIATLEGHEDVVISAAFSPDGKRIVTASRDGTARVWNAADGDAIGPPLRHDAAVNAASFSPDGQRIVTASDDRRARIWDAADGDAITTLQGHVGSVISADFSPDGTKVVTASGDGTARLWNATSGRELAAMRHDGPLTSAAFSADGKLLLTASDDRTARMWDASTGREIARFAGHDARIFSAAFNRDATRVVTASADDSTTRVWDAAMAKPIAILEGHADIVSSALFSPDGKRVVTASADGTARVWDAATGQPIGKPLRRHYGAVTSVAFSPDGKRMVTAPGDVTARVWDAASGEPIGELKGHEECLERGVQPRREAHRHRVLGRDGAHLGHRDRPADRRTTQRPRRAS